MIKGTNSRGITKRVVGQYREENHCRGCLEGSLKKLLPLGETPLANQLLRADQGDIEEEFFPLTLSLCENCSLVQILETVDPKQMFADYPYFSSYSQTMLDHAGALAERITTEQKLGQASLVLEIASNDGYLLKNYVAQGIPVLGVEPAQNIATVAQKNGVQTVCEFFSQELASRLLQDGFAADVIHANNVLAHVPGIHSVLSGFKTLLKDGGIVVSESPYLLEMMDHGEFDTIYHEHLFYYSLTSSDYLFRRNGLTIYDVEPLKIHGGSLRIFAKRSTEPGLAVRPSVTKLLAREAQRNIKSVSAYAAFIANVQTMKSEITALLTDLKKQGKRIAGYGASAKGSTFLNYCGIGDKLEYLVDRSAAKQGLLAPGTHLPIYSTDHLVKDRPDYVLLLSWNFAEEILAQQQSYRQGGGKFVIPIPELKIV
jgi:hypothetical protein